MLTKYGSVEVKEEVVDMGERLGRECKNPWCAYRETDHYHAICPRCFGDLSNKRAAKDHMHLWCRMMDKKRSLLWKIECWMDGYFDTACLVLVFCWIIWLLWSGHLWVSYLDGKLTL